MIPGPQAKPEMWDVFISHASQDDAYIDTLKRTFVAAGIRVWVDDAVLRWGNRLRSRIDDGLKRSRFVIVVFSQAFIGGKSGRSTNLILHSPSKPSTGSAFCLCGMG